jgi:hypothetical protein
MESYIRLDSEEPKVFGQHFLKGTMSQQKLSDGVKAVPFACFKTGCILHRGSGVFCTEAPPQEERIPKFWDKLCL